MATRGHLGGLARVDRRRGARARRRRQGHRHHRDGRRRPGRSRHHPHRRRLDRRRWCRAPATMCRRSRPASWRSPTSSSSTRRIAKAPTGWCRRSRRTWRCTRYADGEWRPPILKTVATTGARRRRAGRGDRAVSRAFGRRRRRRGARRAASTACASWSRTASWIISSARCSAPGELGIDGRSHRRARARSVHGGERAPARALQCDQSPNQ